MKTYKDIFPPSPETEREVNLWVSLESLGYLDGEGLKEVADKALERLRAEGGISLPSILNKRMESLRGDVAKNLFKLCSEKAEGERLEAISKILRSAARDGVKLGELREPGTGRSLAHVAGLAGAEDLYYALMDIAKATGNPLDDGLEDVTGSNPVQLLEDALLAEADLREKYISSRGRLKSYNCSFKGLTDQDMERIARSGVPEDVKAFDAQYNEIRNPGLLKLCEVLPEGLELLDLRGNAISAAGLGRFAGRLPRGLKWLSLSDNRICTENESDFNNLKDFAENLPPALTWLNLSWNELYEEDLYELVKALDKNPDLTLDVSRTEIKITSLEEYGRLEEKYKDRLILEPNWEDYY